jgi:hypothetical protein
VTASLNVRLTTPFVSAVAGDEEACGDGAISPDIGAGNFPPPLAVWRLMARRALLDALLVLLAGCGEGGNGQASAPPALDPLILSVGERAAYPPGSLRPGGKDVCTNGSVSTVAIFPEPGEGVGAVADGVRSWASLEIESKAGGTMIVRCGE